MIEKSFATYEEATEFLLRELDSLHEIDVVDVDVTVRFINNQYQVLVWQGDED